VLLVTRPMMPEAVTEMLSPEHFMFWRQQHKVKSRSVRP
jgi:hypothetical protein